MNEINWYTIDNSDSIKGNNIIDSNERAANAKAAMEIAKAKTKKYNKSIGSILNREYADTPEFFVRNNCEKTPNPNFNHHLSYVGKLHINEVIK